MNWTILWTIVAIVLGLFGQWGLLAYFAGRWTRTVEAVIGDVAEAKADIDKTNKRIDGYGVWMRTANEKTTERLNTHEGRLATVEEWKRAETAR